MDCRETQSHIIPFIEGKLNDEDTKALISHIKQCNDCYDELEVYFIVLSGAKQLDSDNTAEDISDFKGELQRYIAEREALVIKHKNRHVRNVIAGIFASVVTLCIFIASYFVVTREIDVHLAIRNQVVPLIYQGSGGAVRKSVEQTLDIHYEMYSGFDELVINREVPDKEAVDREESSFN